MMEEREQERMMATIDGGASTDGTLVTGEGNSAIGCDSASTPLEATASSSSSSSSSSSESESAPTPIMSTNLQSIAKERPSYANSSNNSSSDDDTATQQRPGVFHVDERAPNLSSGFFRGMNVPGGRLRLREERAARRRAQNNTSEPPAPPQDENDATGISENSVAVAGAGEGVGAGSRIPNRRNLLQNNATRASENGVAGAGAAAGSRIPSRRNLLQNNGTGTSENGVAGAGNRLPSRRNLLSAEVNLFSALRSSMRPDEIDTALISATLVEDEEVFMATHVVDDSPDSEVEKIVQRLESRNANRVAVPLEVKKTFLRLCKEACKSRIEREMKKDNDGERSAKEVNIGDSIGDSFPPCLLREDIIQIRNAIRFELEDRSQFQRVRDGFKSRLGFRCHSKLILNALNRAVDLIDESSHAKAQERRRSGLDPSDIETGDTEADAEWFYYNDFAFYNLKEESDYPWMRNAGVFAFMVTFLFYIFTPILWCTVLRDPNICPEEGYQGWLSSLFFASATMSTVGYGDRTVFTGSDELDTDEPETLRVFIAILFMIFSLVVSVVGFQAGLDSQFNPFRRRLDIFGKRVYEILKD
ncbi:hypothetical protein ACHAXR_002992, partial [Thalassiosira sp. AJA248-18]